MKKIIVFFILIVTLVVGIFLAIKFKNSHKKIANSSSSDLSTNVNSSNDQTVIIKDENSGEDVKISNEDIEYMESIENLKSEEIVENKILAMESKKRNIELTEKQRQEIDSLTNSVIQKDNNNENRKGLVEDYYTDITLAYNLKEMILKEIGAYSLSIEDDELNKKMEEYKSIRDNSNSSSMTQSEIANEFRKSNKLVKEMQELYISKIKEKYEIKY